VRKHNLWASATLALAIAAVTAACGGSPSSSGSTTSSGCINASAPHRAYVVVEHLSGSTKQQCVGFTGDTIDGQALMDQSKLEFAAQTFSFGKAVCQVDNEPKTFTQCFPQNQPYWSLFVETNGAWAQAQSGYTQVTLHDKEALGWHYVAASAASPSPPPLAKES
jgi:hypothetical protein